MIDRTGQLFYADTHHRIFTLCDTFILVLGRGRREEDYRCLVMSKRDPLWCVDIYDGSENWDTGFIRVA